MLEDVQNFHGCHKMYLKSSERFDQKLDIVVNLENGYQELLKQMKNISELVDEMTNLKLIDAQNSVFAEKQFRGVDSVNLSEGKETQM